ncbi:MAG TPA: DNA topoisomerase IV subunit A [Bacilli bacterium]|nr:DNA topoisomerase IV subunit A [Bacilli bacterium]HQA55527.1 DNA topoisomerase IV subunit A [Bacilli bacterium]
MAKKPEVIVEETFKEKISIEPLENVMGDRYATYAKYVIQDRAIPDVRDGLKPVQRRIIFSMYKSNNLFNKPTKKCAHTVGTVMGTYHPHGDSSIYEALARMSQDWKVRYPLIDFQGNNGSIDGDAPAAYRYTESRLSELSNEMVKNIDKNTVDMQLNFDDTELEPTVLPARFPNLLCNGTEGIAVALATEIPPHNLREVVEAIIYRINHKTATTEDLLNFVKGPDFPGGGIIYESEGLKNIYLTGRGRIEVSAKAEIVKTKDLQQVVITEIPYKTVKIQLVYEIDKIIHSKSVSGLLEVRDESDWKGIRIVIDCKKDAKADLLLKYLMKKTSLLSSYNANMVSIVNGRPRTLSLIEILDAYIAHQVEVITRQSRFDLIKFSDRLHIVTGLITASLSINEVVDIIRKSKDKNDSKINLSKRFGFTNEQAEAIVTMPLYKLSHTDEEVLEKEKIQLEKDIAALNDILGDENKLNRVLIKDLKQLSVKYGDDRRTAIEDKIEMEPIDKRDLIAKEAVIVAATRDGYIKRSSIKSYKGSGADALPGLKSGDCLVSAGEAFTTDYLVCFTNLGNYACIPVHKIIESKWKDEGVHLNTFITLGAGEKVIKAIAISKFRDDIYLAVLSRFGQIKRMASTALDVGSRPRLSRYMRLLSSDEVADVQVLTGNSDLLVLTSNGYATRFNENELTILSSKAGGVKSVTGLGKNQTVSLFAFNGEEKGKILIFTDKGHERVLDPNKVPCTPRLGKPMLIMPCFKSDTHRIVYALKAKTQVNGDYTVNLGLNNQIVFAYKVEDLYLTDINKYAKKNISIPSKTRVDYVFDDSLDYIYKDTVSHPIIQKEPKEKAVPSAEEMMSDSSEKSSKEEAGTFEQISIFDDEE